MKPHFTQLAIICLAAALAPLGAQQADSASAQISQSADISADSVVSVLGYTTFAAAEGMPGLSVTAFRAQMHYLKEQGITPVSLQQFLDWRSGKAGLPARCVLITLDEADISAYKVAFPVLREFGFPFVVFADGRNFQAGSAALDVEKLLEMQQAGASIGCRSMNRPLACDWQHALLGGPDAALKMAERELGLPAQRITAAFGSCDAFSYPRGYANTHIVENLAVYGYKVAFGLRSGKVQKQSLSYMLNRNMVTDMPDFAKAVNFGAEADDENILQQVRATAAAHLPVSLPTEVKSPDAASMVMTNLVENTAAAAAEQPPLPPVLDPVTGAPVEPGVVPAAPIPVPVVQEASLEEIKDPELTPRPVSLKPAAGQLARRTPDADWTTVEFPQPVVPRAHTKVAVLGYHNFSNTRPVSDMLMRTSEFCQQMQYIQDAGLTVISMQDFLDWLLGNRCLPERCVLITIDDGWRSVYSDAYPVLKAYGYPFTLFLYTDYLSGRGQSMTPEMIREMMANGATIGCHSATHLYPSQWKRYEQDSPEYAAQLKQEFSDAVVKLKELFGNCSTYCYPGGYNTPPMLEALKTAGTSAAFTVLEKKVTTLENPLLVHRYMVFGTDPRIFRRAVNFDDVPGIRPTAQGITEARQRARLFFPKAFEVAPPPVLKPAQPAEPSTTIAPPQKMTPPRAQLDDIPQPIYSTPE